ncbi:hypothetical protein ABBQ32_003803 [Trebouxia sp. C0010 RCD-2024]
MLLTAALCASFWCHGAVATWSMQRPAASAMSGSVHGVLDCRLTCPGHGSVEVFCPRQALFVLARLLVEALFHAHVSPVHTANADAKSIASFVKRYLQFCLVCCHSLPIAAGHLAIWCWSW